MKKTEINYKDIGKVTFINSDRSRSYRIKITHSSEIIVTIPRFGTKKYAESFLMSKKNWVLKSLQNNKYKIKTYSFGTEKYNDFVSLTIIIGDILKSKLTNSGEIIITLPSEANISEYQNIIEGIRNGYLSIIAKKIISDKLSYLSYKTGLDYEKLKINSAKTRWGSCSQKNNINFSKFLILLPEELIDYVIIHELCHTVHKNHSKQFHDLVDNYCDGKEKYYVREIKKQGTK